MRPGWRVLVLVCWAQASVICRVAIEASQSGAAVTQKPSTAQSTSKTQNAACEGDLGTALPAVLGLTLCSGAAPIPSDSTSKPETGAQVAAIEAGSRAEASGLKAGDILHTIAGERLTDGRDAADRLRASQGSLRIIVNYRRAGVPYLAHL